MSRTGAVRLSRRFLDFTAHQDLQLTAGLDLDWPRAAKAAVGGGRSSSNKLKAVSVLAWQGVGLAKGQSRLAVDVGGGCGCAAGEL
jgi:hypothetical protein